MPIWGNIFFYPVLNPDSFCSIIKNVRYGKYQLIFFQLFDCLTCEMKWGEIFSDQTQRYFLNNLGGGDEEVGQNKIKMMLVMPNSSFCKHVLAWPVANHFTWWYAAAFWGYFKRALHHCIFQCSKSFSVFGT